MYALTLISAMLCGAHLQIANESVYDISQSIRNNSFKKVGVLPQFIIVQGDKETLGGSLGPQAALLSQELEEKLINLAARADSGFKVVDGRRMKKAFEGLTIDDLGNEESLKKVAEKCGGLDAIVVCSINDQRGDAAVKSDVTLKTRLVEIAGGSVVATKSETKIFTLADAALAGESFEALRFSQGRLTNVGLATRRPQSPRVYVPGDVNEISPFGKGDYYDEAHYELLLKNRPHPLEDPTCPFDVWVQVGEDRRPTTKIGSKLYVPIAPGETYQVLIQNREAADAYMTLYVDGINVLGKKRESVDVAKFWYLKPNGKFRFKGWMTPKEGTPGQFDQEEFVLVAADDSVAVSQGFSDQLGVITAVFSTVGMGKVPKAPELKSKFANLNVGGTQSGFGTGAGTKSTVNVDLASNDKPGVILGAITLHYATPSQIKALQAGK